MSEKNDSLIEISASIMKKKRKPQTLKAIATETFEKKGISLKDYNTLAQFEVDFMISGLFIYCGEDSKGNQLWDLKERQPSSLLDKDGGLVEDIYADDEDVVKNELKDEDEIYEEKSEYSLEDDEEKDEQDDIEEELGLVADDETSNDEMEIKNESDEDEDEDETLEEDEEDDIEEELNKTK